MCVSDGGKSYWKFTFLHGEIRNTHVCSAHISYTLIYTHTRGYIFTCVCLYVVQYTWKYTYTHAWIYIYIHSWGDLKLNLWRHKLIAWRRDEWDKSSGEESKSKKEKLEAARTEKMVPAASHFSQRGYKQSSTRVTVPCTPMADRAPWPWRSFPWSLMQSQRPSKWPSKQPLPLIRDSTWKTCSALL